MLVLATKDDGHDIYKGMELVSAHEENRNLNAFLNCLDDGRYDLSMLSITG